MKTSLILACLLLFAAAAQAQPVVVDSIRAYVPISDRLATSGQPTAEQFQAIRDAGFDMVINLAPPSDMHANEGFQVTSTGMSYLQIPVDFKNPQLSELDLFSRVMEANPDRKIWVHCFANMRVAVFVYLYRTLNTDASEEEALAALHKVWEPEGAWPGFIETARKHYNGTR